MTAPTPRPPRFDARRGQDIADPVPPSERGRLLARQLDDRRWQDIVDEATELIKHYAPQWTDRNPSDIGMTLIELFAWLVESLIYRLNRVPDNHYVALLNLLGITRAPQQPARTLLTFTASDGPVTVGRGTAAQTAGSETDAPVVFETDTELTVVPLHLAGAGRVDNPAPGSAGQPPAGPPGSTRVRLERGHGVQACLAVDTAGRTPRTVDLYVEPFRPPTVPVQVERIDWVFSAAAHPPANDPLRRQPWDAGGWGPWRRLEVVQDGTAGLMRPGIVRLRIPDGVDWAVQDPQDPDPAKAWTVPGRASLPTGPHQWLGLRITNDTPAPPAGTPPAPPLELRLDRLLPNTTTAANVRTVTNEPLGTGTGEPGQLVRLAQWPVHTRPGTDTPYDELRITVGGVAWQPVEELPDAPGPVYLLDPVSGEVTFGDGDRTAGRGTAPAVGQAIVAERYRYVAAGAAGNLLAGTVRMLSAGPAAGTGPGRLTGVTNPVPAVGGVDEESIEQTKVRGPDVLRYRGRAVTADDYELLARAVPGIAITRCLPPMLHAATGDPWTYGNLQRAPGVVNVLVVPDLGPDVPAPVPSLALVQEVLRVLDRRQPIATALHVDGPRYLTIGVNVEVTIFRTAIDQGLVAGPEQVCADIERDVRAYLHPVHGRAGAGWQIGQSVYLSELYQAARPPEAIGFITSLTLVPEELLYAPGDPENQRPIPDTIGEESNHVRVADFELICPGTIQVRPTDQDVR